MPNVYSSPEWLAIMKKIQGNLQDDVIRLAAADYLEEHQEYQRAEFIRVQIARANREDVGRRLSTRRRESDLMKFNDFKINGWVNVIPQWEPYEGNSRSVIWRRGFVAEVRCFLVEWVGGECGHCQGTRTWFDQGEPRKCPACSDGRLPGHGPEIARLGALERVKLTDRKAWQASDGFWRWSCQTEIANGPEFLPSALLQNGMTDEEGWVRRYDTEAAANDAVSRSAIEWAFPQKESNG